MKIFNLIKSFFNNDKIDLNKAMNEIDQQEDSIKSTLTNLLFQQAKLTQKRESEISKLEIIAVDLDQAINDNDEPMSVYLLEQTDLMKTDIAFIDEELTNLNESIKDLSDSRSQLGLNKEKYKNQLISNSYKLESLKSKKKINAQIQSVSSFQMDSNTPLDKLKLQVLKAQAELEVLKNNSNPFEAKRYSNRKLRQSNKYKDQFEKLKKSREALV
jgi:phage shock protein A